MSEELLSLRKQIDAVDDQVLRLLNERARLAQSVGHVKNGVVYKPEREAQVVRRMQADNPGPLPAESISVLYKEIMSACRALEQPLSIAYLGPLGTFSEAAAIKHFGHATQGLACASIDDVFRAVERGEANYGVAPVENSTEGAVNRTLDLLLTSPLKICGEVMLRVRQHLMRRGEGLDGIEVIYSHSQSLGQCHEWLNQHMRGVKTIQATSNGEAARLASENPDAAAIAGELAAERYGLDIVARDIEDEANNTTRFLVLGREETAPSGCDKTSLVLSARHRPSALLELLVPLAAYKINILKLESRPARNSAWEYVFHIDIDGHCINDNIQKALHEILELGVSVKILGSYPVAV
ncbi:MAG: chorismate mutase [Hydrogenophilales bacterium 28-61-23]|nr:MAG: chorismate mutase [Hydrogenophilales bacterium 28-61-23]